MCTCLCACVQGVSACVRAHVRATVRVWAVRTALSALSQASDSPRRSCARHQQTAAMGACLCRQCGARRLRSASSAANEVAVEGQGCSAGSGLRLSVAMPVHVIPAPSRTVLGPCSDRARTTSDHPRTTLGPCSDHPRTVLGPCSDHLGPPSDRARTTLGPCSDHPRTVLGPCLDRARTEVS